MLQRGSSTGGSSCQEPAPAWALLCRLQLPSGHIHLLWHGALHQLQHEYLRHHDPPWAAGWIPAPAMGSPQAAAPSGEIHLLGRGFSRGITSRRVVGAPTPAFPPGLAWLFLTALSLLCFPQGACLWLWSWAVCCRGVAKARGSSGLSPPRRDSCSHLSAPWYRNPVEVLTSA